MVKDNSKETTVFRAKGCGDRKFNLEGNNGQHLIQNRSTVISVSVLL